MSRSLFVTLTAILLAGSAAAVGQDQKPIEEDPGQHQQQPGSRSPGRLPARHSANWGMLGAVHKLGRGSLMLRSKLSLEPATVTDRR